MVKLIYLLGPEGAGKTIQAKLILWYLKVYAHKLVFITEVRSKNMLMYVLSCFLMNIGRKEYYKHPSGAFVAIIDRVFLRKIISLWLLLEFINFLIAIFVKVLLPLLIGYTIILTRYVIDFLTDMYALGLTYRKISKLLYIIACVSLRLIPKGTHIIYLDADYNTLYKRYIMRGSFIESQHWIRIYKNISMRLFNYIAQLNNQYNVIYIDTTHSTIVNVFRNIINILSW